jgi:hypothetical protein
MATRRPISSLTHDREMGIHEVGLHWPEMLRLSNANLVASNSNPRPTASREAGLNTPEHGWTMTGLARDRRHFSVQCVHTTGRTVSGMHGKTIIAGAIKTGIHLLGVHCVGPCRSAQALPIASWHPPASADVSACYVSPSDMFFLLPESRDMLNVNLGR